MDLKNNGNIEPVDWRDDKTLQDCMTYMLEKEAMCDVTFRVGKGRKSIKAHKNILASRSDVFHTMFEGSLPEKEEIDIPDIDEDTFKKILRYAYTDVVKISNKNVTSMLYAAEKYMLTTVKTKCSERLRSTATSADAVVTLSTANQFHLEDLLKESLQYIEENTEICLSSSYAVELNSDCVQMILMSEHLSCSETEVCNFFLKWIETQCTMQGQEVNAKNMRGIAEGLMRFIRFPLVEKKYFSNEVSHSKLLTKDEIISVYRYHHGEKSLLFSDKPRYPMIPNKNGQTICIYRHATCNYTVQSCLTHALKFHLNRSIWLKGCIIFGPAETHNSYGRYQADNESIVSRNDYYDSEEECRPIIESTEDSHNEEDSKFTFELTDDSDNVVCWEVLDITSGTSFNNTVALTFEKPILLKSEKQYTISVRDIKPQTFLGIDCKSVCIKDGVTITFENSPKSTVSTNVTQGQIAGIMYSV
ncbi:BTB/POZ domain-containing protein 6-like [Mytilus trossulus]|uniref:BTB/POZ domain-containing protein 6-like n=1 Tax=Mytilus trossulus TaxID=6551 RepID=UPI003007D943